MTAISETWTISLLPATLARLKPVILKLAEDEWEDERVQRDLYDFANDIRSRLQRIEVGDVQRS
jgi:hypothetical protein